MVEKIIRNILKIIVSYTPYKHKCKLSMFLIHEIK